MKNNKLNVILDTNVIVSSLITTNEHSPIAKVMDLFYDEKINVYYSDEIINEYIEVLNRDKFKFNKTYIQYIIKFIKEYAIKINVSHIKISNIFMKELHQPLLLHVLYSNHYH